MKGGFGDGSPIIISCMKEFGGMEERNVV